MGQIDGFFSQLPYKRHHNRVAFVGDLLKICPWVARAITETAQLLSSEKGNSYMGANSLEMGSCGFLRFFSSSLRLSSLELSDTTIYEP